MGGGFVRSSRASAIDEDIHLAVQSDGDECRAVVAGEGRDVLCASGGRTVIGSRVQPHDVACPHGGRAVSWGSDVNGSGLLDPSELEGSTFVCAHARGGLGRNALVSRKALSLRDGHCPAGGTLVQAGIDRDGDGVLSDSEIDRATFACHRFGGPALVAVVTVTAEPNGARCVNGGQRIAISHEGEIPRVSYVCNAP